MKKIFNINDVRYIDVVSFGNEKGHMLSNSLSSGPPGTLPPGSIPQPGVPNGYAPLDINIKIPPKFLPTSTGTPHHIFATQSAMLAGGSGIIAGEIALVHGDPDNSKNGEYIALQDAPTLITHYDHRGEYVATHRHDGADVDVNQPFSVDVVHLQDFLDEPYAPVGLPDEALSAGSLRHMVIGRTYNFPTEKFETFPGSGVMIDVAKTHIIGIPKTNHHYINACIIRTGVHTWIAEAEEYTGTDRQPTTVWSLDLDPAWSDHSGIGDIGARSFTSITTTIIEEIGDATLLGADNLVDRLIHEETERHTLSTRIATLEGGVAHQHADVIQDFKLQVNNQGLHYCILNDRPTNPDHIGKDLFDGAEHKVQLEWDTAPPYDTTVPFDPAHVTDGGNTVNWVTGPKPNVWIQEGSNFKQLVDPTTMQVLGYAAITSFVDAGSILTVKWNLVETRLEILKVQVPTVHVVTSPDHQPLQVGGTIKAKSLPFQPTIASPALENNTLFLDDADKVLKWKDNAGVIKVVTLTP